MSCKASASESDGEVTQPTKLRFHHLDWMRASMIVCVVYAHVSRMGLKDGVLGEVHIDNHAYIGEDPNTLGTRWVSFIRQWCLPMLFWVSGGGAACSYGRVHFQLAKLTAYTAVGIVLNTVLWYLSPQNSKCDPGTFRENPECKGVFFDFTIVPWAGNIFPIIFQMWYTIFLAVLLVLNTALFGSLTGDARCGAVAVGLQWIVSSCIYATLAHLAGWLVPNWNLLVGLLVAYEGVFLATAYLTAPGRRPEWLPLRVMHYLAAMTVLLQFAATPVVNSMNTISPAFVLYIFVGFNKFLQLGFIMTRARCGRREDDAAPLLSAYWPLAPILVALVTPSSNWYQAGNLTYPYFPRMEDRCLYVAGALALVFFVDRYDRLESSAPLPASFGNGALLLYLLHPTLMTLILWSYPKDWVTVETVWLSSVAFVAVFIAVVDGCRATLARRRRELGFFSDEDSTGEE